MGILTLVVLDIVRCHMVLVLDVVLAKKGSVKIMIVCAWASGSHLPTLLDHIDFEG
jgi:hypothetical protein